MSNSRRPTRTKPQVHQHTITWQHPLTEKGHVLHVSVTEDYLTPGTSHIEIQSAKSGEPNPISTTGYRSHFIDQGELTAGGGLMSYVTAWINREMPAFRRNALKNNQTSLFDWADAQVAATPARPAAATRKRRQAAERQPR